MKDLKNKGWVRLFRQIEDNPLWLLEPFTKAQAWIDLFLNANHKEGVINIRGNIIKIERGQLGWSELTMAKRWKWSKGKVRRFLKILETEQQIIQQKDRYLTTIITILNYENYQSEKNDTADSTAERQQTVHKQECKNDKNINNSNKLPISKKDLLKDMGIKQVNTQQWQQEALELIKAFNVPEDRVSSVFKCFKDNPRNAKFAFSDCKELGKMNINYFFKIYNELNKKLSTVNKTQ